MIVEADEHPEAGRAAEALIAALLANGAELHPDATLVIETGGVYVTAPSPGRNTDPLIWVPVACLPPPAVFTLLADGRIGLVERVLELPVPVQAVAARLADFYNALDKLARHAAEHPLFALDGCRALRDHLLAGRQGAVAMDHVAALDDPARRPRLLLQTFLDCRHFHVAWLGDCVPPLIDCVNHHSLAHSIQAPEDGSGIWVVNSQPRNGSSECFIRYRIMDPLDSFLSYAFIDESLDLVRSVPVTVYPWEDVALSVAAAGEPAPDARDMPADIADLRPFFPAEVTVEDDAMEISDLVLPGSGKPVHRVLAALLGRVRPDAPEAECRAAAARAEAAIVRGNQRYYEDLRALAEACPEDNVCVANVHHLCAVQEKRLAGHARRLGMAAAP